MKTAYERSKEFSNRKLDELRAAISDKAAPEDIVVTCGSYARREASSNSDIDFFLVTGSETDTDDEGGDAAKTIESITGAISPIVPIEPAAGGAFANREIYRAMLSNIGGDGDTNQKTTRRMLFLLEGEALFNSDKLKSLRRAMLERYIGPKITDHQLALFLLNDIIRYYRTIATDYEFKTTEGGKPWGIRNIKLVFSRKLLYTSGLFSVALTADRVRERKISLLEGLFEMPAIDRMIHICGPSRVEEVLRSYNQFLDRMENAQVREELMALEPDDRTNSTFRELKNEGHHFTRELMKLFEVTFDSTHPVRRAVIF